MNIYKNNDDNEMTIKDIPYGTIFEINDRRRGAAGPLTAMKVLVDHESRSLVINVKNGNEIQEALMSDTAKPYPNATLFLGGKGPDVPAKLNDPEGRERNIATTTKLTGNGEQPLREIAPGGMFKIDAARWAGLEKKSYGLGERVDELLGMRLAGPESDNGEVRAVNLKTGTRMLLDGSVPVERAWEITLTDVDY